VWQFGQRAIIWTGYRGRLGDVLDVIDFQERFAAVDDVLDVAGAVRVLASALAAQDDRSSCDA
jgi:hypothetical protein